MDDKKKKSENNNLHIKTSLDDLLTTSAMGISGFTGFSKMIIDDVKEEIGENNYKKWSVIVFSSFEEFRNKIENSFYKDSFIPYCCKSDETMKLYKYFISKGMIGMNENEVNNPRGILFLKNNY